MITSWVRDTTYRAHTRIRGFTWPPAGAASLDCANPRWVCPQGRTNKTAQKSARARRLTVITSKLRPLQAPRIWIVAQWTGPPRCDDGDWCRQGQERAHPRTSRHVDAHELVNAVEKSIVDNSSRETNGIEGMHERKRRGSGSRRRIERTIGALRVTEHHDRPLRARRRIRQVVGGPPLRIRGKIKAKSGILRPPDRARIRAAEDHIGGPGLVDEGGGAELSERARPQPSDRIAHAQAAESRAGAGSLEERTILVCRR